MAEGAYDAALRLDATVFATVTVTLDGKPMARGNLVAVDDNFGVQLTEIL